MHAVRSRDSGTVMAKIEVHLLRPFSVSVNGVCMDPRAWRLRHPRLLFQLLCLRPGQRLHRDEVVDWLWPQSELAVAANRLYHSVHMLRAEFSKMGLPQDEPVLMFQAGSLWLNATHTLDVDVRHFDTAVHAARATQDPHQRVALLGPAAALCGFGPSTLLPMRPLAKAGRKSGRGKQLDGKQGCRLPPGVVPAAGRPSTQTPAGLRHEACLEPYRRDLRDKLVWLLEWLAQHHRNQGDSAQAARLLQQLTLVEPSNEMAHRMLMAALHANDDGRGAQAQSPAGAPAQQPAAALGQAPTARRMPLLGREAELTELRAWLDDPACRFITLCAPAGTGKTSLALALARSLEGAFADGVHVVRLTPLQDAAGLAQWVGQALGAQAPASLQVPLQVPLQDHLADKQLLLVLDRFEHLVAAAAQVSMWLQAAPGLRVIVTSQCVLACQAERVFALRQLAQSSPAAALELFMRAAGEAGAAAAQSSGPDLVAALCDHLGGNALAIQLAAAQWGAWAQSQAQHQAQHQAPPRCLPASSGSSQAFDPVRDPPREHTAAPAAQPGHASPQWIDQLSHGIFGPLTAALARRHDDEPQHRSLSAAIGWSMSLLDPVSRALLQGLAVFHGSFTTHDVGAVLGTAMAGMWTDAPSPTHSPAHLHQALMVLLDRQLLARDPVPAPEGQEPGLVLLDSIRQFLWDQSADFAPWPVVQAAHAAHFAAAVHQAAALAAQGQAHAATQALTALEQDALQALRWLHGQGQKQERRSEPVLPQLQLCHDLSALQIVGGGISGAIQRLQAAVALPVRTDAERELQAQCYRHLSRALRLANDVPGSVRALLLARRTVAGLGNRSLLASISRSLAYVRCAQLRLRAATMHIDAVMPLWQAHMTPRHWALDHAVRAAISSLSGDYAQAHVDIAKGLDAAERAGDWYLAMAARYSALEVSVRRGLLDRAHAEAKEFTALLTGPVDTLRFSALLLLFSMHLEAEEFAQAHQCLDQAQDIARACQLPRAFWVDLGRAFISLESGAGSAAALVGADESVCPFDGECADFYIQVHCHRLRLLAQPGDASGLHAAYLTLQNLLVRLRRSRNPLWTSWVSTALAWVATGLSQSAAAGTFLGAAQALQTAAGILPTPRQRRQWQALRVALCPPTGAVPPSALGDAARVNARPDMARSGAASVPQSIDLLARWGASWLGGAEQSAERSAEPLAQAKPHRRQRVSAVQLN
jgi:predicted ATPase/DNA-binding SARP family transcriptional activator